jgi:sialic acid synthase SpsE
MKSTYFIADIAANHDGDINRAKKLCFLAKKSGADAVKFQHFKADTIVSNEGFKSIQSNNSHQSNWKKSVYEVYNDASVPLSWTNELKQYCNKINIDFFTTPYDLDYVDHLNEFVDCYKIGSGDITWHEMLHKVGEKRKPTIIATGASTIQEVIDAINILTLYDIDICLMQCNTNYTVTPDNFKHINLKVLELYKTLYPNIRLGLSDHTLGDVTTLGAIALGATMIEKHFTDDNNREGPDHAFSMNPLSWKKMVEQAKLLELSLGNSIKKVENNEKETVILQRRAYWLNKDLPEGHVITNEDISVVRPCPLNAIPPNIPIIGKTLLTYKKQNSYITYYDIK